MLKPRTLILAGIVVIAVLTRFLPLPPNVAPIAAMALFGGAYFADKRLALLIPLAAMLVSDLILGLHGTLLFVYVSFAAIVGLGMLVGKNITPLNVGTAAISGSLLFFVVTNFGVWLTSPFYPLTLEGLITCFTLAIPFFHYTLLGDAIFVTILFGGFEWARHRFPALQAA